MVEVASLVANMSDCDKQGLHHDDGGLCARSSSWSCGALTVAGGKASVKGEASLALRVLPARLLIECCGCHCISRWQWCCSIWLDPLFVRDCRTSAAALWTATVCYAAKIHVVGRVRYNAHCSLRSFPDLNQIQFMVAADHSLPVLAATLPLIRRSSAPSLALLVMRGPTSTVPSLHLCSPLFPNSNSF